MKIRRTRSAPSSIADREGVALKHPAPSISTEDSRPDADGGGSPPACDDPRCPRTAELEKALRENEKITRALRASEDHYRLLVEHSPMCIHEIDLHGKVCSMNRAGLTMLGMKDVGEVLGYTYLDAVATRDRERIAGLLAAAFAGKSSHFEFLASPAGEKVYKSCFIPILDKHGGVEKLMGITEDVTERKRSEESLIRIQRLLNETEQIGNVGGWEFNIGAEKLIWSQEVYRILEVDDDFEPTVGKALAFYTPGSRPVIERALLQAVEQGEPFDLELEIVTAKGRLRCVHAIGRVDRESQRVHGFFQDITEHKRVEESLVAREREFRTLAENSPDNIGRYDCTGRTLYVNPAFERALGHPARFQIGKTPQEIVPGALFEGYQQALLQVGASGHSMSIEQTLPAGKERPRVYAFNIVPESGKDGLPVDVLAVGRDISEMKWAEENLHIIASVFESSQEGITIADADANIVDVNPAFTRITGYSRKEVLGKNPKLLSSGRHDKAFYLDMWHALDQKKAWRGEIWNRRKNGEIYAELLSIAAICDDHGKVQRYVGVFSDIDYLKIHEAELSQFANFDSLTGIPNRRLLADRLTQAVARAKRTGMMLSVCLIDLDGFKQINDNFGHEAGDQLLVEVARRLQNVLRAEDTLARLGGDEFVVVFNDLASTDERNLILERILEMIAAPITIDHHQVTISASIGVASYSRGIENSDNLLRRADQAMYAAKEAGKGRYRLHDENCKCD